MASKLRPTEFVVTDCSGRCSLSVHASPIHEALHDGFCAGMNDAEIVRMSDKLGHHVSLGATGRHRMNHLSRVDQTGVVTLGDRMEDPKDSAVAKVDHVKVLEMMIDRGSRIAHTWKLGPETTLKAIEMHFRLTEGKNENALLEALSLAAAAGAAEPDAYASSDEREQGAE